MKNIILAFLLFSFATTSSAQQYYMTGRFVNTAPDSTSLDSVAFVFTPTTYAYYINASTTPSSTGTYAVIDASTDSLVLFEDSLGVCNTNGGGSKISFALSYTISPYYSIDIFETAQSIDSCPSHSYKIQGQYIGYEGEVIFTNSVKETNAVSSLQAYVYENRLFVKSRYREKVSIDIRSINGQKLEKNRELMLTDDQYSAVDLNGFSPGIYYIVIRSEHERKTLKLVF